MKLKALLGIFFIAWACASVADEVTDVSVDRTWGLLIGDVLTMTANLPVDVDQIDPSSLPQHDKRYGVWLYLSSLDTQDNKLKMVFQVVNVPQETQQVATPEFVLRGFDDTFYTISPQKISLGSLLVESPTLQIQADHIPTLEDTRSIKKQLSMFVIVSIALIAIWFIWHIGWRFKHRRPFAQAVHDLNRLRWSRSTEANQAARILHAAFNASSGTIVVQNNLQQTLATLPWLDSLSDQIEQFYQQSEQHFFHRDSNDEPKLADVIKLAKACRAKEKLA